MNTRQSLLKLSGIIGAASTTISSFWMLLTVLLVRVFSPIKDLLSNYDYSSLNTDTITVRTFLAIASFAFSLLIYNYSKLNDQDYKKVNGTVLIISILLFFLGEVISGIISLTAYIVNTSAITFSRDKSLRTKLLELKELKDSGSIQEEEYQRKRKEILGLE